jgi:hypothetical protein
MTTKPMNSTEAAIDLIDTVLKMFPPYRWDAEQEEIYGKTVIAKLKEFPVAVITETRDKIVGDRDDRRTPMVSEIIAIAKEVDLWQKRQQGELVTTEQKETRFSEERERLANDICKGPIGRQAAREGWVLPLWNFIVEHNRAPEGAAIEACKRTAKESLEFYDELLRKDDRSAMHKALLGIAEGIQRRRRNLEVMILGKEAA